MKPDRIIIYSLLIAGGLSLLFCSRDLPKTSPYLNTADGVKYVGMSTCRSCHTDIYNTFIHTGMGSSFDLATPQKSAATYGKHALVYDPQSDFYYKPFFQDSALYILEFRLEAGDTVYKRLEKVSYIVGSGQHTNSHIVDFNGYIYQAPITFYTQKGAWDLAPGFDEFNERFDRVLTTECITCHNNYPTPVAGSLNKYSQMPRGIECERCHGPGEIHVREKLAGSLVDTATAIDYTIVNPRKLPRDLQMDLCQRCHLQGVAVLQPGKTFFDFKPGMRLNEVMNVFLPRFSNSHKKFIMASQADRLRKSACYQNSDMSCLTCHNPHVSVKVTGGEHFNVACQNCHSGKDQKICSANPAVRQAENDNCSGCHMPRSGSTDIPHVNITDHFISKTSTRNLLAQADNTGEKAAFLGLQILTKEKPTPLDMAQGYIATFDKYIPSTIMLDSARYYLDRCRQSAKEVFDTRIHYFFATRDYSGIVKTAEGYSPEQITEGWTAYRIGEALYQIQDLPRATSFYKRAVDLMPYTLDFREKLGVSYLAQRQIPEAITAFEWVLKENPKRKLALTNLGFAYVLGRRIADGEACYDRALALDPDYPQALLNKAAVRMLQNDVEGARRLVTQLLKRDPENAQAREALARMR